MACLRSLEILHEIYILFKDDAAVLLDNLKMKPVNPVKLQMCINTDGTVTITLPGRNNHEIYARFNGSGTVELWSALKGTDIFWIEEPGCTPEQVSNSFMALLREHGFEFAGSFILEESHSKPTIFECARLIGLKA